jgi:hypothetical protein
MGPFLISDTRKKENNCRKMTAAWLPFVSETFYLCSLCYDTIKRATLITGQRTTMKKQIILSYLAISIVILSGCTTAYKATPMSFKMPAAYGNAVEAGGAQIAARAFLEAEETKNTFGFDIRGAKIFPVQVVVDNQGDHAIEINAEQTFLEDQAGNLWPVLTRRIAHERATKYAKTNEIFKESAYKGFLGAAAGSLIGAAIGIATGDNIGEAMGKGAAVGAAAGATMGGIEGSVSEKEERKITNDLREKDLKNRAIAPKSLANGFLFCPGEAGTSSRLRLQIIETDTKKAYTVHLNL